MRRVLALIGAIGLLFFLLQASSAQGARVPTACTGSSTYAKFTNLNHNPGVYQEDTVINGDLHVCMDSPTSNLAGVVQVFSVTDNIQLWNAHVNITLTAGVDKFVEGFYQTLHFEHLEPYSIAIRALLKTNGVQDPIACTSYVYAVNQSAPDPDPLVQSNDCAEG
jgi:hypothetical protein